MLQPTLKLFNINKAKVDATDFWFGCAVKIMKLTNKVLAFDKKLKIVRYMITLSTFGMSTLINVLNKYIASNKENEHTDCR